MPTANIPVSFIFGALSVVAGGAIGLMAMPNWLSNYCLAGCSIIAIGSGILRLATGFSISVQEPIPRATLDVMLKNDSSLYFSLLPSDLITKATTRLYPPRQPFKGVKLRDRRRATMDERRRNLSRPDSSTDSGILKHTPLWSTYALVLFFIARVLHVVIAGLFHLIFRRK